MNCVYRDSTFGNLMVFVQIGKVLLVKISIACGFT